MSAPSLAEMIEDMMDVYFDMVDERRDLEGLPPLSEKERREEVKEALSELLADEPDDRMKLGQARVIGERLWEEFGEEWNAEKMKAEVIRVLVETGDCDDLADAERIYALYEKEEAADDPIGKAYERAYHEVDAQGVTMGVQQVNAILSWMHDLGIERMEAVRYVRENTDLCDPTYDEFVRDQGGIPARLPEGTFEAVAAQ